jgi:hypothetical protein
MLNRRDFLKWGGTGLSGIALTTLLAEQVLLASDAGRSDPRLIHRDRTRRVRRIFQQRRSAC